MAGAARAIRPAADRRGARELAPETLVDGAGRLSGAAGRRLHPQGAARDLVPVAAVHVALRDLRHLDEQVLLERDRIQPEVEQPRVLDVEVVLVGLLAR